MNRIIFTGGGSAGHVTPNIALIEACKLQSWDLAYIGSETGIERQLITKRNIPYYPISTAKLNRFLTFQNLFIPWRVFKGVVQAYCILGRLKPHLVFSKGGFVSLPVVVAAWFRRIPVVAHEADYSPGLANRLAYPFLNTLCLSFKQTQDFFKSSTKIEVTGLPIRPFLLQGNEVRGLNFCGFTRNRPILLVMGGGLGAQHVNQVIRALLPTLTQNHQVIHLCGQGKVDPTIQYPGYLQFAYLDQALPDILACADLVISRAGANAIWELLALRKPHILIPLIQGSRGDQVQNADYFAEQRLSWVIPDNDLTPSSLLAMIETAMGELTSQKQRLADYPLPNAVEAIMAIFKRYLHP